MVELMNCRMLMTVLDDWRAEVLTSARVVRLLVSFKFASNGNDQVPAPLSSCASPADAAGPAFNGTKPPGTPSTSLLPAFCAAVSDCIRRGFWWRVIHRCHVDFEPGAHRGELRFDVFRFHTGFSFGPAREGRKVTSFTRGRGLNLQFGL